MCKLGSHICYCGKVYTCTLPNWVCPTINEDEDAFMCDECLEKYEASYNEFIDSPESHEPLNIRVIPWKKS